MNCPDCGGMELLNLVENHYRCRECGYLFTDD